MTDATPDPVACHVNNPAASISTQRIAFTMPPNIQSRRNVGDANSPPIAARYRPPDTVSVVPIT